MRRLLLCAVLLCSSIGLAQTDGIDQPGLWRGLTLPPTTGALVDESTAPVLNPAGLLFVGGPELIYLHERNVARNRVGDGIYLGTSFFRTVAAGLNVEWLRSNTGVDYRKTQWTLAVGTPIISVGATLNLFSARESPSLDGMSSVSLGVSARPWRFLALAASVQNVEAPHFGLVTLPRQYRVGAAARPFGERYALAVDYVFGGIL